MSPPPRRYGAEHGPPSATRGLTSNPHVASAFDVATARVIQVGYAAVSLLTGDPAPSALMNTYLAADRRAYDGIFLLTEAQVERIIENSPSISSVFSMQISLVKQALVEALRGASEAAGGAEMARWASDIVTRLRGATQRIGALASEDITTADFAEVVKGARTSGAWVQLEPRAFSAYVSFGTLRIHLAGRVRAEPASPGGPELIRASLRPQIRDVFDFHVAHDDSGTGWMDHALARLQRAGYTKPFRIEGTGSQRDFVVRAA